MVRAALLVLTLCTGCSRTDTPREVVVLERSEETRPTLGETARRQLLADLAWLADDARAGRAVGTPGNAEVRDWLITRFDQLGLEPFGGTYTQAFEVSVRRTARAGGQTGVGDAAPMGANIVGRVKGRRPGGRVMVVMAHFDHLGVRGGEIYNGADDNGSGTAALLAAAEWFARRPAEHDILFAALDAEEIGLQGARAFVNAPPVPLDSIALVVNMDMIGRNERGEIYAAGATPWPALRAPLETVAERAPVTLLLGHDTPGSGMNDWTFQSDHGPFHAAGIPFVYFGVDDHADYHRPTDDFDRIRPDFFIGATETVIMAVEALDVVAGTLTR